MWLNGAAIRELKGSDTKSALILEKVSVWVVEEFKCTELCFAEAIESEYSLFNLIAA